MSTPAIAPVSRLPDVGVSIFTTMSRLAQERGAINLSQGFPDFDCAPELIDLVRDWFGRGVNQYAPMAGAVRLRRAIAATIARVYGLTCDPDSEITVTAGATEALFSAITAFVHPGDEVIVVEPCYDSYVPAIHLAGGRPVFVTLRYPEYRIDWTEFRRALSARTRLILLNSPHNPTGTMLSADDLETLGSLLDGSDVLVLSDEVYEHVAFDGRRHVTLGRVASLRERTAVVSSFGKSFHTTGWKVGYVSAPRALTTEIQRVHQFVTFAVNTPVQHAYAEFLERTPDFSEVGRFYEAKRNRFLELTADSPFRAVPCQGTYFQILDYSAIGTGPDVEMAMSLLNDHGVAAIPTSAFMYASQSPPVLRFCFAKRDETLEAAAARLRRI